jgi:hypothetical protein
MKSTRIHLICVYILLIIVFQACETYEEAKPPLEIKPITTIDQEIFSQRIVSTNKLLRWKTGKEGKAVTTMAFTEVSTILPPTINGSTLQACYVSFSYFDIPNQGAAIAYNTAGSGYGGGYDYLNVQHLPSVSIEFNSYFTGIDISIVELEADSDHTPVVAGGSANLSKYPGMNSSAILIVHGVIDVWVIDVPGNCVNGLQRVEYFTTFTTGSIGGIGVTGGMPLSSDSYTFFPNNNILAFQQQSEYNTGLGVAEGFVLYSGGLVREFTMGMGLQFSFTDLEIQLSGCSNTDAKHSICQKGSRIMVALGDGGMMIYDYIEDKVVFSMAKPPTEEGGEYLDYVTNGITWEDDYVFIANGAAGLTVLKEYGDTYLIVGTLDLDASVNHVAAFPTNLYYTHKLLLVACGAQGSKVITFTE